MKIYSLLAISLLKYLQGEANFDESNDKTSLVNETIEYLNIS